MAGTGGRPDARNKARARDIGDQMTAIFSGRKNITAVTVVAPVNILVTCIPETAVIRGKQLTFLIGVAEAKVARICQTLYDVYIGINRANRSAAFIDKILQCKQNIFQIYNTVFVNIHCRVTVFGHGHSQNGESIQKSKSTIFIDIILLLHRSNIEYQRKCQQKQDCNIKNFFIFSLFYEIETEITLSQKPSKPLYSHGRLQAEYLPAKYTNS